MISVLIVDDQDLVRMGLRTLLEHADGFSVAGEAADGLAAVELARRLRPDVVLMDIRMPGIDGLTATDRVLSDPATSETKVLVLTTFEHDEYVFEALRNGASGFLLKNTAPPQLLEAIQTVADGGSLLSPTVTRTLIREFTELAPSPRTPHPRLTELTTREREVMALVGRGLSNEEIAEELVVSPATARTHVSRAMLKLGARDRAQMVVFAYQSGLV
jgi:DNA-binding NarL/FixJ family response regulator